MLSRSFFFPKHCVVFLDGSLTELMTHDLFSSQKLDLQHTLREVEANTVKVWLLHKI